MIMNKHLFHEKANFRTLVNFESFHSMTFDPNLTRFLTTFDFYDKHILKVYIQTFPTSYILAVRYSGNLNFEKSVVRRSTISYSYAKHRLYICSAR